MKEDADCKNAASRQDALLEVIDIMQRHRLSLQDIANAMADPALVKAEKSSGILSRLFAYMGGIFVFVGLVVYVGMRWDDLGSAGRIIITLGPGFCAFIMALFFTSDIRLERAATPLFLVAVFLEPAGIMVMLREYSRGGDPAHGLLFMNLVMALQQGFAFLARNRTVLALTALIFFFSSMGIALDLLWVNPHLIAIIMGCSMTCTGWGLGRSQHRSIAFLFYFVGSVLYLSSSYDWVRSTIVEVIFPGLACATIFISTLARSRTLLLVGTLSLIGYLGDFMGRHFAHNLNAPLFLVLMGFMLIVVGLLAVKINNRFIRQT